MKILKIIKAVIYLLSAALVIVFRQTLVENIKYLVASVAIIYGIETILEHIFEKKKITEPNKLFLGVEEVLLGLVILILMNDYPHVCIVWAILSMLREIGEIEEAVIYIVNKKTVDFLSLIESTVMLVFAVILMISPTQEHAMIHIFLLSVELVTTVIFPQIYNYIDNKRQEKKEKAANS